MPSCQAEDPGPTWGLWLILSCLVILVVMEPVCPGWGAPRGRRSRPVALLCVVPSQLAVHRSGQLLVMMSYERETCGTSGPGRSPLGGPSVGTGSGIAGTFHSHYQALCPVFLARKGKMKSASEKDFRNFNETSPDSEGNR